MLTKLLVTTTAAFGILILAPARGRVRPEQMNRGEEWMSWSREERATYIAGYITGYRQASLAACDAADALFEVGQPHRLGDEHHSSELPSARCLARMEEYSKATYSPTSGVDLSAYVEVITDFYAKHPEYDGISFVDLMKFLGDRNYKTADQLYRMALKGELRPLR